MMKFPYDQIEELFSLQKGEGLDLWWELVHDIAAARRQVAEGPVASTALKGVAKRHGLYFLNADSRMKAAIKPMLTATEDALHYAGLYPKKRTSCGLAEAAADLYNFWLWTEQNREKSGS